MNIQSLEMIIKMQSKLDQSNFLERLGKFLSKTYGEQDNYDWQLELFFKDSGTFASIYANENDLFYLKEEIEKLPQTIASEFNCISQYDVWGECRCGEEDKEWIVEIKIKSENAAEVFNQHIDKLLNNEFANKLSKIFHKSFEYVEPYVGQKGNYAAEIFCFEGVEEIKSLIQESGIENNVLYSNCNLNHGDIQILISTEETLTKIKSKIESHKSLFSNPASVNQGFFYHLESSVQTGSSLNNINNLLSHESKNGI